MWCFFFPTDVRLCVDQLDGRCEMLQKKKKKNPTPINIIKLDVLDRRDGEGELVIEQITYLRKSSISSETSHFCLGNPTF